MVYEDGAGQAFLAEAHRLNRGHTTGVAKKDQKMQDKAVNDLRGLRTERVTSPEA